MKPASAALIREPRYVQARGKFMNIGEQIKSHSIYALAVLQIPIIVGVWYLSETLRVNPKKEQIEWFEKQVIPLKEQVAALSQKNKELNDLVVSLQKKITEQNKPVDPPPPSPPDPDCKVISSLNACLTALKFFEYGRFNDKVYKQPPCFAQVFTKDIGAEITLQHPKPGHRIDFVIQALLLDERGRVIGTIQKNSYIDADWERSFHTLNIRPDMPRVVSSGFWADVGSYKLNIVINDQKVTSGIFEVFTQ
jgi:hypothetical protein